MKRMAVISYSLLILSGCLASSNQTTVYSGQSEHYLGTYKVNGENRELMIELLNESNQVIYFDLDDINETGAYSTEFSDEQNQIYVQLDSSLTLTLTHDGKKDSIELKEQKQNQKGRQPWSLIN